ncbi:C-type lectin 13 [Aphelenchoides avenae]|nr:C-type lectin 13 [Aphelenchus avenae]
MQSENADISSIFSTTTNATGSRDVRTPPASWRRSALSLKDRSLDALSRYRNEILAIIAYVALLIAFSAYIRTLHRPSISYESANLPLLYVTSTKSVPTMDATASSAPALSNIHCDSDGWRLYGTKCYKVCMLFNFLDMTLFQPFLSAFRGFWGGREQCEEAGGVPTSIHNAEQNEWLSEFTRDKYLREYEFYIGLFYSEADDSWHWIDGSNFVFNAWYTGEPSNASGIETCVEVRAHQGQLAGKWNDVICERPIPTMCQKDAME